MSRLFPALLTLASLYPLVRASSGISSVTPAQWQQLNQQVGGRLHQGVPFASPCFATGSQKVNQTACSFVQSGYLNECKLFVRLSMSY
jgi:hypothetical protein